MSPFTIFETILSSYPFTVEKNIESKHCGMLGTVVYYTVRSSCGNIMFEMLLTESKHYTAWIHHRSIGISRTPDFVGVQVYCRRGEVNLDKVCFRNTVAEIKDIFKAILDEGFVHLGYYMYPDEVIEEFTSSTEKRGA